jgi:hypothetical protein
LEKDKHPFLYDEADWFRACLAQGILFLALVSAPNGPRVLGAKVGPQETLVQEFGNYPNSPPAGRDVLPETLRMTQVRGQLQAVDHAQDRVKVRARGHQIPMAEACCKPAALWRGSLVPEGRYLSWLDAPSAPLCQRYAELFRVIKLWQQLIALEPNGEPAQCALMQAALNGTKRGDATWILNQRRASMSFKRGLGPSTQAVALYKKALAIPAVGSVSQTDGIRASLAWRLLNLHS